VPGLTKHEFTGHLYSPILFRYMSLTLKWFQVNLYFIQWKPLIMINLGPALFDNNNRLITFSGGYKNLHYLTQFIVTTLFSFYSSHTHENLKVCTNESYRYTYSYFYSLCSALRPPCPFAVEFHCPLSSSLVNS
jgi:hypothetical protein